MGEKGSDRSRFWRQHVEQYLQGELTLREYCTHHELSRSTFGYWRRKLRQAASPTKVESAIHIARVELSSAPAVMRAPFEVVLHSARCIRVPMDFDSAALQRLVVTLERLR